MFLLAVLNVLVLVAFSLSVRRMSIYLYSIVNFMLFLLPVFLAATLGAFHPRFRPYHADLYPTALIFVLLFNVTFALTFTSLVHRLPELRILQRIRRSNRLDAPAGLAPLVVFVAAVLGVSVGSKLILNSMGAFRMLDAVAMSSMLQFYKELGGLDLFLLAYLGELKRRPSAPGGVNAVYLFAMGVSVIAALISGSRFQVIMVLLLAAIAHRDTLKRHIVLTIASLFVILPNVAVIFPLLAFYRRNGYDLGTAVERVGSTVGDRPMLLLEITTQRLNYFHVFASVMDQVRQTGPAGGLVYWNNIIGVVPRLLWPGKPEISNDSRQLGHALGMVTADDRTTSIGLQIIGEAFYEFGWLGLMVAVLQGLLFAFAERQLGHRSSPAFYALYISAVVYLLSRDGYFAIVPGLIWLSIGFAMFLLLGHFAIGAGTADPRAASRRAI